MILRHLEGIPRDTIFVEMEAIGETIETPPEVENVLETCINTGSHVQCSQLFVLSGGDRIPHSPPDFRRFPLDTNSVILMTL